MGARAPDAHGRRWREGGLHFPGELWQRRPADELRPHEEPVGFDEFMVGEDVRAVPAQDAGDFMDQPVLVGTVDQEKL